MNFSPLLALGAALTVFTTFPPFTAAEDTPASASPPPLVIDVWPGLAPGETSSGVGTAVTTGGVTRRGDVLTPRLTIYTPISPQPHCPAVIVMPGGGYSYLSEDLEGTEIADWLNSLGYAAAVLDYRVPNNRNGAYQDAQRSVSLLRSMADRLGIDPYRLGVIGFSAGGDLAARTAVGYTTRSYEPIDAVDQISCRPDFALLVYPAYLIDKTTQTPAPEVAPHSGMCPMFLTQTRDDPYFDVEAYAEALQKAGVSVECDIYEKGGHGYGLRLPSSEPAHAWSGKAADWLEKQTVDMP